MFGSVVACRIAEVRYARRKQTRRWCVERMRLAAFDCFRLNVSTLDGDCQHCGDEILGLYFWS